MIRHIEIGISGEELRPHSMAYIKELASKLQINGAVFTKHDGGIRVSADGDEKHLEEFIKNLENGSIFGDAENFYVKWYESQRGLGNFYIASE